MLNRRQRREFEQKAAKETKAHWGLGFRDGHPVGPSAPLRSSSPSLRSRRTRSRAAYRAEPTEWPPQQACACRHADTGPCVRATPLRHRGRLERRRRPYRMTMTETQLLIHLCFLCCLLFKFSSLPSVEHRSKRFRAASQQHEADRKTSRHGPPHSAAPFKPRERLERRRRSLPDDHDGHRPPDSPLFPLLPSVQILFAAFC